MGCCPSVLQVAANQASCSVPGCRATGFELQHIDERHEVHARVVKAVIPLVVGDFPESVEVFRDRCIGGVVLTGTVCNSLVRRRESICCARSNSAGLDR